MKISEFFLKTTKTGHFHQKIEQKANENLSKQLFNIGLTKIVKKCRSNCKVKRTSRSILFGQADELIIFTVCQIVFSLKWCIGWLLLLLGSWKLFHLLCVVHFFSVRSSKVTYPKISQCLWPRWIKKSSIRALFFRFFIENGVLIGDKICQVSWNKELTWRKSVKHLIYHKVGRMILVC